MLGVGSIFSASIISTLLGFVLTTYLAQSMLPEGFGLYRYLLDTYTTFFPLLLFGFQYTWIQKIAATYDLRLQSEIKGTAVLILFTLIGLTVAVTSYLMGGSISTEVTPKYHFVLIFSVLLTVPLLQDITDNVLVAQGKIIFSAFFLITITAVKIIFTLLLPVPIDLSLLVYGTSTVTTVLSLVFLIVTGISFKPKLQTIRMILLDNYKIGLPLYYSGVIVLVARAILQLFTGLRLNSIEYAALSLATMVAGLSSYVPTAISKVKFKDFAKISRIDKNLLTSCLLLIGVVSLVLWLLSYVYVDYFLSAEYRELLMYVPIFLAANAIRSQGEILNRFFYAQGNVKILSRISFIMGIGSLIIGSLLLYYFGIWGVVIERVWSSTAFSALYIVAYIRYAKNIEI